MGMPAAEFGDAWRIGADAACRMGGPALQGRATPPSAPRHAYSRPPARRAVSRGPVTRRLLCISIPIELADRIDRYTKTSGAKSRSAAVTELLTGALASSSK